MRPSDNSSLWGFSSAAAADFADWPAVCTYLEQFRIFLFTFTGSYSKFDAIRPHVKRRI